MGLLDQVSPRVRRGLSEDTVRLLLREPQRKSTAKKHSTVSVPAERYHSASAAQISRRRKKG